MKKDFKKAKNIKPVCFTVLAVLVAVLFSGLLSSCSKPLVIPGASMGYFIWKDDSSNIHIVWSSDRKERNFSGVIKTDGDFTAVTKEGIEDDDKIIHSAKEISFDASLDPEDYSDGLSISVSKNSFIDFNLKLDDKYDFSRIHIGKYLNNPSSEEFRIDNLYFENLRMVPWYNNHPFIEFFNKLYANKYLTFIYIYLLGAILIGLLRITKLSGLRKKVLINGLLYFILFILDAGFIILLWYANGH